MPPKPLNVTVSVFNESTHWSLPEVYLEQIRRAAEGLNVRVARTREELSHLLPDTHVLFGWVLSEEDFRRARGSLEWVQLTSAGADTVLAIPAVQHASTIITSAAGVHKVQASEHVLMLMLALARQLQRCVRAQVERRWIAGEMTDAMFELQGHTVGIVALGEIGMAVAERAKTFGMKVLATKRHIEEEDYLFVDRVMPPEDLNDMLALSDVVVLTVPLTDKTRGMIGARQFRAMKAHAVLINVSRGAVVDEGALVEALQKERIAGAALDVFEQEPLPVDSPLWRMENVIITPHVGGISPRYWERATALFCENLRRFVAGRPLLHEVDRQRGY